MTTTNEQDTTRTLTIHREVSAVAVMTVAASAALVDTGGEPAPDDVRVVLEVVDLTGDVHAFEFAVEDVTAIRARLDAAELAAVGLRGLYS